MTKGLESGNIIQFLIGNFRFLLDCSIQNSPNKIYNRFEFTCLLLSKSKIPHRESQITISASIPQLGEHLPQK
ncbi:MAG: hypothetical protein KA716_24870 [Gloeotrichia echinulata DEX184]|nr:hypothetical protein [Gloeotrichia echinulata DEX184]